jgi:hypothetical protein
MSGDKLKIKEAASVCARPQELSSFFRWLDRAIAPLHLDALLVGFDFCSGRLMKDYL